MSDDVGWTVPVESIPPYTPPPLWHRVALLEERVAELEAALKDRNGNGTGKLTTPGETSDNGLAHE